MDPETLYRQLGRLIETAPNFNFMGDLAAEHLQWIGRANVLIKASGDISLQAEFSIASGAMSGPRRGEATKKAMMVLYKVLADAELRAPAGAQGAFIPVGNSFDAFAALTKVLSAATRDILIVDPYLDETVLTDFSGAVPVGVGLRLLADQASAKESLKPAATRWVSQHPTKSLEVRLAAPRMLHDRVILIDGTAAWTLTQSIKDFAKRSPAEIVRAEDTASLKNAAYEDIWKNSSVIV